jgi:alanine racemase
MPSQSSAVGILTIDLAALADNWRMLSRRVAPAECGAVVKANAYGIGVEAAAPALYRAGCRTFFVALVSEGTRLRAALDFARDVRIFVLNGLPGDADLKNDYLAPQLSPVIGAPPEAARWLKFCADLSRPLPYAIHVDTGMNRLGFANRSDLVEAFGNSPSPSGTVLLMSHFVSSEESQNPLNAAQITRFEEVRALFPAMPASLANSSALFLPQRPFYDLARPGYALYGGNPTPGLANPMKPVVSLKLPIQQMRLIEAGETVGYNGQWTARRRTRLATLLAGYADGLPRAAGATKAYPGADVVISGQRCPLVGRISMDLCIADITDLPEDSARPGDYAQILGDVIGVDEFGERSGTIGYHILTSLGSRYRRVYRNGQG